MLAEATTRAGAYCLVEHIASGGMGVVYLAERDDGQVRHQAAVKILRVRDRVSLMRDVARAVEHGHRNLIVHRDLKPATSSSPPMGR